MRLLLDTHALLWFIGDDLRLSNRVRVLPEADDNDLLLSIASLWEIAIKLNTRKLSIGGPFASFIPQQLAINHIELVDITIDHLNIVSELPPHHRDPFDRLIIAQSIAEGLPVISIDEKFDDYSIERLW